MSGIAGQYNLNQQAISPDDLEKMLTTLAHRGPDKQGVWHDHQIGLAHCLLQTTPESREEHQPLISAKTGCVITADARIDNRLELINRLNLTTEKQPTDIELILAAYEEWGENSPNSLLGAFAFAIWDPHKQCLFCARDHFGVKPFFYRQCEVQQSTSTNNEPPQEQHTILFASEIKALLDDTVLCQINDLRIADFLQSSITNAAITIYQGILRLLPGHWLSVTSEGLQSEPYWQLEPLPELSLASDQDYADAFLAHFTEAIQCRLRSITAIGCHLSGGLDSSAVTCVARHLLEYQKNQLHTFSNVFDQVMECDEREYIYPVIDQGGLSPHFIHPDRVGPLTDWQTLIQAGEEPCLMGGNGYLVRALNQAVRSQNLRVCLDGFDGDTTVSHGLLHFSELAAKGDWTRFAAEAQAIAPNFCTSPAAILQQHGFSHLRRLAQQRRWWSFAMAVNGIDRHFRVSRKQLWVKIGLKSIVPRIVWRTYLKLRGHAQEAVPSPLNSALLKRWESQGGHQAAETQPATPQEEQLQTFTSGAFCHILEQVDLQAAACSIEVRHPFMDKRLIEFCMSLPSTQRLQSGWSRLIMRRALEGLLPKSVQWRGGKTNMTPSFQQGLMRFNQQLLQEVITGQLPYDRKPASHYVDWASVEPAYQRLVTNAQVSEVDQQLIWKATVLSLWLHHSSFLWKK